MEPTPMKHVLTVLLTDIAVGLVVLAVCVWRR